MSNLQLNEQKTHYKEFYGQNIKQMPKLIAEQRIPLSVSDLMQKRLEVLTSLDELKSAWWDNWFYAGDAVLYHPDEKIKIVLDSQDLREITPKSKLKNGALVLKDGAYEQAQGQEFTKKQLEKYVNKELTKRTAKTNPIWKALARNPELLKEYVNFVFSQAKQRFDYKTNMGSYVSSFQDVPTLRPWFVGRLGGRSRAYGGSYLDYDLGRLVGVLASETQDTRKQRKEKPLENRIQKALNKTKAFEYNGILYVPIADKKVKLKQ